MTSGGFRADIEGLRAVAIAAVLLCHAQLPFASGGYVGVDVFFVISGFLITRLLVREVDRTGTISLKGFYARRVRRILPLAALVLVAVVIASLVLVSPVGEPRVATDVGAAAAYVVNWLFAARAVDYFADTAASPVQHYWSLAIEEQFYLVWPGLLLLVSWPWRRARRDSRTAMLVAVAVVAAASFAYGVWFTREVPSAAYFSTFTRVWELALGAMIALARIPALPRPIAAGLAWAGLAAIGYAVLSFSGLTEFPGTAALVPTLGAAALIVAGTSHPSAPSRLLAARAPRYVGRISYSWYLWHWPALIFAGVVLGPLTVTEACLVVAGSWVPAAISHHTVEEPLRRAELFRRRPLRAAALWATCTSVAVAGAVALAASVPSFPTARHVEGAAASLGKHPHLETSAKAIRPNPLDAAADKGPLADDGCFLHHEDATSPACAYGVPSSDKTVVLFGDSHAMQYFPAIERIATARRWRLVVLTKTACSPASVDLYSGMLGRRYTECDDWRAKSLQRIETTEHPSLVIVSSAPPGIYEPLRNGDELTGNAAKTELERGYASTLNQLRPTGAEVAVIKDPAQPPEDIPDCVSESLDRLGHCSFPLPSGYGETFDAQATRAVKDVHLVDLTQLLCPDRVCPAVIGNALVYRTQGHLTATFAATLAPELARKLPSLSP
jgi:peptidoglycan/LPS O-acetylase OafA/YrhL